MRQLRIELVSDVIEKDSRHRVSVQRFTYSLKQRPLLHNGLRLLPILQSLRICVLSFRQIKLRLGNDTQPFVIEHNGLFVRFQPRTGLVELFPIREYADIANRAQDRF